MSEEFQKTLFDPFTREERSGTNKVQGTGLGMAITRSIVDLMGGSIRVESAPGRGTRFEVVLEFPIDAEADTVQEAQVLPEEAEETSPLSSMKFLCAEDTPSTPKFWSCCWNPRAHTAKFTPTVRRSWMPLPASSPASTT